MAKKFRSVLALVLVLTLCVAQFVMPANAASVNYEYVQIIVNGQVVTTHSGGSKNDSWLIRGTYDTPVVNVVGTTVTYTIGNQKNKTATIPLPEGYTVGKYTVTVTVSGTNSEGASYDNAIINIKLETMITPGGEEVPVDPVQTSVTVNHTYYTKDLYTGETTEDGSTSGSYAAVENDSFTAASEPTYGGNTYTQTTADSALTITVSADPANNVIYIDYLRIIDTTPADTAATVIHTYYTKDLYTGMTGKDGSNSTTASNLKERDSFTASPENTYGGNLYTQITDASALTITLAADASQNVIYIDYLRTIDTTPAKTSVTVNHHYFTEDLYTGETVKDGSGSESFAATERDDFTAIAVTAYNGNDYTQTTDDAALTIKVVADASKNVIDIYYLRTIDTTPVNYVPTVSVEKTADKAEYEVGETITWTVKVTNTSDYVAYDVVVIDEMVGGSWLIETLEPGGFRTFTATSVAAEAGTVKNVVVTSWTDNDEIPDEEETDEPKSSGDEESVEVKEPVPPATEPPATEPPATEPAPAEDYGVAEADGLFEIPDEDVPLADVPKTGDMSLLWIVLSAASAGGAVLLNKKREED